MAKPDCIVVEGARHNNLKDLDLEIPLNELLVVTGVSGSGKSSLAFDTIYAEGQRRYVETFSPYARQFLDRMDRPKAERIDGIPPAIAIDQTNPVRTSRSTVGTMTELNDHIKLLFARATRLVCPGCGRTVRRDSPDSIIDTLLRDARGSEARVQITFSVGIPHNFTAGEVKDLLARQGYSRIHRTRRDSVEVIQDRVRLTADSRSRLAEALEAALKHGRGGVTVYPLGANRKPGRAQRFSSRLHCAQCDRDFTDPVPNLFSFNSPIGACEACRGFGRTMGIDYTRVIPDETLSLERGAVKPWQTDSYREWQNDLLRHARRCGVPVDRPWKRLRASHRRWVLEGEGDFSSRKWYGVRRFFDYLESKSYKMHIRVLLSRYRSYDRCPRCEGARLRPEAMNWRLGSRENADAVLAGAARFKPPAVGFGDKRLRALDGLTIHDVMLLPIARCRNFFSNLTLPSPLDQAADLLLQEIRSRLQYLCEVGLDYLTLDRQSRTLSGGEVQRINLTTALGTSLVNALFVLDEPSIGLHARDLQRIIAVLHRLRDAGNSLIVVEHDEQVIRAADRVLDLGPGPGERGGEIVFFGKTGRLLRSRKSLTAAYLSGKTSVRGETRPPAHRRGSGAGMLKVIEARANNLARIDVEFPLNRLVCLCGVSGSGKSTLITDVCYKALRKLQGRPVDPPGAHRALEGHERIGDVVLVDQSPIGRTTRSNPASYVGAFDAIRKLFSAEPLARERGYKPGTFSFNSGAGRCPACGGNGFEHVEMQFLSDVYLRCADCDGRRYRDEVLEVRLLQPGAAHGRHRAPRSIADVLEMTVTEAIEFFGASRDVLRGLQPLSKVGLGYLRLGQPVPSLSGGEAQRLKLAGHLAKASSENTLFLFDEPTTGLHFADIGVLLGAFRELLGQGHSLIVVEHNLDVLAAADWLIELGPGGGEHGGRIVARGTPKQLAARKRSPTGTALREQASRSDAPPATESRPAAVSPANHAARNDAIRIFKAREHNLRNVDIRIPRDAFTVITGVSGSGKSTVAFDIVFAEGQRRYLESLNAYARQFVQPAAKPDVDAIFGIPPTVAIEQRTSRGGRKSTVATLTEIYHFLRLLFVKLGTQYCPGCDLPIAPQTPEAVTAKVLEAQRGKRVVLLAPLVVARKGYYTDLAAWAAGKGFSHLRVDGKLTASAEWPRLDRFQEHDIEVPVGTITVTARSEGRLRGLVAQALGLGGGLVRVLPEGSRGNGTLFSIRRACAGCGRSFEELDPRMFSYNSKHGWCAICFGTGVQLAEFDAGQTGEERWWNEGWDGDTPACSACGGCG